MNKQELKNRTKAFSLRTIRLTSALPSNRVGNIIADQILRSATSVGANYRSACRARSNADFINKIAIILEEADETLFWLELILEAGLIKEQQLASIMQEANELVSIFAAALKTSRMTNQSRSKKSKI